MHTVSRLKMALIGCGSIANAIASRADKNKLSIACVYDMDKKKAASFAKTFRTKSVPFAGLLKCSAGIVVEAASQQAVRDLVPRVLAAGKSTMIMSTGALADARLLRKIRLLAEKNDLKVYLPSGAIAGIDAIKAADGEIESVMITTTKSPASLLGAPFFKKHPLKLGEIKKPITIYSGTAQEAAKLFPSNINVAATLGIAGIGVKRTKVRIIADPKAKLNMHEILAKGKFGTIKTRVENTPRAGNAKTSHLAALSALATLKKITQAIQVGT